MIAGYDYEREERAWGPRKATTAWCHQERQLSNPDLPDPYGIDELKVRHNPYSTMIRFVQANPDIGKEDFLRAWSALFKGDEIYDRRRTAQLSSTHQYQLSALVFVEEGMEFSKAMREAYISSGIGPDELMRDASERAREIAAGASMQLDSDDPLKDGAAHFATEMVAASMVLKHPLWNHCTANDKILLSGANIPPLDAAVYSRPFGFSVSAQTPVQREIHVGIINEYIAPIRKLSSHDRRVKWARDVVDNGVNNGLKIVYREIQEFLARYQGEDGVASSNLITAKNVDGFIEFVLQALAKRRKSLPGVKVLPELLIANVVSDLRVRLQNDSILSFRPTAPFDEVVKGLIALHDFYADFVVSQAHYHFGKDFRLPGKFLSRADEKLGKELGKVKWMDSTKVDINILPSRDALDRFHPYVGDRYCLLHIGCEKYSLDDPRFLPHRILVEGQRPSETLKGGIYQVTVNIQGLKIMILSGVDPRVGFYVNPGEFMDGLEQNFTQIAREGEYDLILVDEIEGSSRKGTMLREILTRYPDRFELAPEDAVGYPVGAPLDNGTPPRADETDKFYMAHRKFRIMADLRKKK